MVKDREEKRWGDRVTEGGDMYEQQASFRKLIAGFTDAKVTDSIGKIDCKIVELDGTCSVKENIEIIKKCNADAEKE